MRKPGIFFTVCLLFLLVGLAIYLPIAYFLPGRLTSRILQREIKIAGYIAEQLKDPLLLEDDLQVNLILQNNLNNLDEAEYLFIQGHKGPIIAHTFLNGFPQELINFNRLRNTASSEKFIFGQKEFYDLAVPVFEGGGYALHLGISLTPCKEEIGEFTMINYSVAGLVFVGLGLGFLGIFILSRDSIKKMAELKERNALADRLHDGLAQSLVAVVTRLEVCSKLIQIDPNRALRELTSLKNDARALVKEAREAIASLGRQK